MKGIKRFCFAMEIRELERHSSGNRDYSLERSEPMLISCDGSSLVVDTLSDRSKGQNAAVSCFYFDFAARKEQTAVSMLGSLLKQMLSRMGRIAED